MNRSLRSAYRGIKSARTGTSSSEVSTGRPAIIFNCIEHGAVIPTTDIQTIRYRMLQAGRASAVALTVVWAGRTRTRGQSSKPTRRDMDDMQRQTMLAESRRQSPLLNASMNRYRPASMNGVGDHSWRRKQPVLECFRQTARCAKTKQKLSLGDRWGYGVLTATSMLRAWITGAAAPCRPGARRNVDAGPVIRGSNRGTGWRDRRSASIWRSQKLNSLRKDRWKNW